MIREQLRHMKVVAGSDNRAIADIVQRAQDELAVLEKDVAALRDVDAEKAAELYEMRSRHILQLAELDKELALETDAEKRKEIERRIALERSLQEAEQAEFNYNLEQTTKRYDDLKKELDALEEAQQQNDSDVAQSALQDQIKAIEAEQKKIQEQQRVQGLKDAIADLQQDNVDLDKERKDILRLRKDLQSEGILDAKTKKEQDARLAEIAAEQAKNNADIQLKNLDLEKAALQAQLAEAQQQDAATTPSTETTDMAALLQLLTQMTNGSTTNYYQYQPTYGSGPDDPARALELMERLRGG
jgi:myosin heavy subunit